MSILQPCPSRPLAICGLFLFEGLISEDAQPGADVEVPLDAEALETLTGFGRVGDMKWNMVQQQDTQQHYRTTNMLQSYTKPHGGKHGSGLLVGFGLGGVVVAFLQAGASGRTHRPQHDPGFRSSPNPRRHACRERGAKISAYHDSVDGFGRRPSCHFEEVSADHAQG